MGFNQMNQMAAPEKLILKIGGRVQGVFFRYNAQKLAKKLNLTGFARNQKDGTVTVEAEGSKENLQIFAEKIKKGLGYAETEVIKEEWSKTEGLFRGFEIL